MNVYEEYKDSPFYHGQDLRELEKDELLKVAMKIKSELLKKEGDVRDRIEMDFNKNISSFDRKIISTLNRFRCG